MGVHKKYSHPERVIASRGNNVERRSWYGGSPYSGEKNVISCKYLRLLITNTLTSKAFLAGEMNGIIRISRAFSVCLCLWYFVL